MWITTGYRIEKLWMEGRWRWFLDAVQVNERGVGTSNICNGDESYCLAERKKLIERAYDAGYQASEQAYPLTSNPHAPKSVDYRLWNLGHNQATSDLRGAS